MGVGLSVTKYLEENTKKNQEFMLAAQRVQLERQIHMQNIYREQLAALHIAKSREQFKWVASFYITCLAAAFVGFKKSGRKELLIPLLPFTFAVGFLGDYAYGSKLPRLQAEARKILLKEKKLVEPPLPIPSINDLDILRKKHEIK